jgi:probable F420-dependent oxidoreductase
VRAPPSRRAAEQAGLASIWITDHIAIPPDDAEGSGGRYLDPLVTLAWLASATERIQLGTGVLILPYRPPLPTAKQVASLQELSGGRLLLGVGIGWMDPEFRALGVDRHQRGRISDETLAFMRRCFESDEVEANGQPFLFKPRPPKPPIFVGGAAPHALRRAARLGDGWLPMRRTPEQIAEARREYDDLTAAEGREPGEIVVMGGLDLEDPSAAAAQLDAYAEAGATRYVCGIRYGDVDEYRRGVDALVAALERR